MSDSKLRRLRDRPTGAATLVNDGCKIIGEIGGHGNFMISGEVDGNCDVEGTVTVSSNGFWKGTIRASDVIVAGRIEGDIAARGRVEISDTAIIAGTVSGDAIAVAEGAVVEGVMKTTSQSEPVKFVEKRDR